MSSAQASTTLRKAVYGTPAGSTAWGSLVAKAVEYKAGMDERFEQVQRSHYEQGRPVKSVTRFQEECIHLPTDLARAGNQFAYYTSCRRCRLQVDYETRLGPGATQRQQEKEDQWVFVAQPVAKGKAKSMPQKSKKPNRTQHFELSDDNYSIPESTPDEIRVQDLVVTAMGPILAQQQEQMALALSQMSAMVRETVAASQEQSQGQIAQVSMQLQNQLLQTNQYVANALAQNASSTDGEEMS
mmetsp:Transcript_73442/g.114956  ORF Transcript_73442/g.114956 Transcript_73442/m.114956 type:complete len:242 (-) Transcript_73442:103-828(-)